jgi:hypothetical protein
MRTRTLLAWISAGLIGLALTAGATYAATQLSSQRIGLSAEPPSAGEMLAPARHAQSATAPAAPPAPASRARDDDRGPDPDRGEEHNEERRKGGGLSDWDD